MADGSPVIAFDPYAARAQFPILSRSVNGKPLVYLDSAASNASVVSLASVCSPRWTLA